VPGQGKGRPWLILDRLSTVMLIAVSSVILVVMTLSFFWNVYSHKARAELEMIDKARLITRQFLAVRTFMAEKRGSGLVVLEHPHLDPALVQPGIDELFGGGSSWHIKEVWVSRSCPTNCPDDFELTMLEKFRNDPGLAEFWGTVNQGGQRVFRYGIPIRMQESCLDCHGGGARGEGEVLAREFEPGELVGAISIWIPMRSLEAELRTDTIWQLVFTFVLIAGSVVAVYVIMTSMVSRPLRELTEMAVALGRGDLDVARRDIDAVGEIRVLARAFQSMAVRLKGFYHKLEAEVEGRTRELTKQKEELRRAYEELAKSSRMKSTFLASMSHELRTPLTAIIAFAELMLEEIPGPLNKRQSEYLQGIMNNGRRLLNIINDILDLAKIEAGRMELKVSTFQIEGLIDEVVRNMMPLAVKKDITVEVSCPVLPAITADRRKIGQVLTNLVGNAIKFTPPGGRIDIKARYDPCRQRVVISVKDTGIGIKRELQDVIFDAFFQADSSSTREYKGTGLGLSLAKHFVEMHGGSIWVTSEPGRGSSFSFALPIDLGGEVSTDER